MIKKPENRKTGKSEKSEKQKKWQNQKSQKLEKWQNAKLKKWQKSVKNRPPLKKAKMSDKWPKSTLCEIRAAWSGVFSIPGGTTGPGFKAEIERGGSRRRILITFCILVFYDLHILIKFVFSHFSESDIFAVSDIFDHPLLHYNKALLQ